MGWITENKGWLVACFVSAVAGALLVLWLKGSKPKNILPNPVVDIPAPVQPRWDDTNLVNPVAIYRLGGSIGETEGAAIDTLTKPTPTPAPEQKSAESRPEPSPCKPFQLRLVSSPTSLSSVLDSVVVLYFYPSGMNTFEYYNRPQTNARIPMPDMRGATLLIGLSTAYSRYQNNISGTAYIGVNLSGLNLRSGYHHQTRQQLSWFVSVGKEWRVF